MSKAAGILFLFAWLVCGSCLDNMFSDSRVFVVAMIALIIALCCMLRLSKEELAERW